MYINNNLEIGVGIIYIYIYIYIYIINTYIHNTAHKTHSLVKSNYVYKPVEVVQQSLLADEHSIVEVVA